MRELSVDDVSDRYLSWLSDAEAEKWIVTAKTAQRISDLKAYVLERSNRDNVLFLGIFEKYSGLHIGNIKYEPIELATSSAVMGVLIGEPTYRGKGVFPEVFKASATWLKNKRGVNHIHLGVEKANQYAVKAYQNIGFTPTLSEGTPTNPDVLMMVLHI